MTSKVLSLLENENPTPTFDEIIKFLREESMESPGKPIIVKLLTLTRINDNGGKSGTQYSANIMSITSKKKEINIDACVGYQFPTTTVNCVMRALEGYADIIEKSGEKIEKISINVAGTGNAEIDGQKYYNFQLPKGDFSDCFDITIDMTK